MYSLHLPLPVPHLVPNPSNPAPSPSSPLLPRYCVAKELLAAGKTTMQDWADRCGVQLLAHVRGGRDSGQTWALRHLDIPRYALLLILMHPDCPFLEPKGGSKGGGKVSKASKAKKAAAGGVGGGGGGGGVVGGCGKGGEGGAGAPSKDDSVEGRVEKVATPTKTKRAPAGSPPKKRRLGKPKLPDPDAIHVDLSNHVYASGASLDQRRFYESKGAPQFCPEMMNDKLLAPLNELLQALEPREEAGGGGSGGESSNGGNGGNGGKGGKGGKQTAERHLSAPVRSWLKRARETGRIQWLEQYWRSDLAAGAILCTGAFKAVVSAPIAPSRSNSKGIRGGKSSGSESGSGSVSGNDSDSYLAAWPRGAPHAAYPTKVRLTIYTFDFQCVARKCTLYLYTDK
jgi:hypothetical protein